jgi:16S rRNA (guanine966-N2)-methyltransferase
VLGDGAVVVAEHSSKKPLEARYSVLQRTRVLEQGDAALSFYAVGKV